MPTADAAGKFTVFNIKGNRLRLRKPVTLLLEILNQQRQQLCQYQTGRVSSGDDDASNQDIVGVGERFAAAFHLLEAKVDGFADIGEGLGDGLALRVTAGDGGADHDVAAIVLIGLEKDFEVAGGHALSTGGKFTALSGGRRVEGSRVEGGSGWTRRLRRSVTGCNVTL